MQGDMERKVLDLFSCPIKKEIIGENHVINKY